MDREVFTLSLVAQAACKKIIRKQIGDPPVPASPRAEMVRVCVISRIDTPLAVCAPPSLHGIKRAVNIGLLPVRLELERSTRIRVPASLVGLRRQRAFSPCAQCRQENVRA